ncbi:unnamed protein product [Lactuca virosa]|uniref:Chloride conductance regulatory protein ICln n=1 Tax=Lactuca virosa TaxID=75947 RepID=A0AAU9LQ75_9ASTR|nr:unnamed protein product [Lactuca virosa]
MGLDTCHSHVSSTGSALSSPIEFLTSDLDFFCFNVPSIPFTASLFSLLRTLGHVIFPPAPTSLLNAHPRHFATVSIEPTRRLLRSYQRRLPDSESNETSDLSKITEMRLVPSDPNQLDALFEVFCECAELNPEPVEEDEPEEHNWIFSADQLGPAMGIIDGVDQEWDFSQTHFTTIGHPNGDHDLAHNVLEHQINDQRFEDVEEMESNNRNGGQE